MKNQKNGTIGTILAISLILGILLVGCGPTGPREQGYQGTEDGAQADGQGYPGMNEGAQGFPRDGMNQGAQGFPRDRMGGPRMNETAMQEMQEKSKAACQDKQEGDSCEMQSPRGNMTGKCFIMDETLSCRPEGPGMRQMPENMPPQ